MKHKPRAVLFDADGVIIFAPRLFSQVYAEQRGLDPESFEPFFAGDFRQALTGKADVKDLIKKNNDIWQWDDDPQALLDLWFKTENHTDADMLKIIAAQRATGMPTYLATDQEQHRVQYFRDIMFPGVFDDIFASSDIGYRKQEPKYWDMVLDRLGRVVPDIEPHQVLYFDDSHGNIQTATSLGINAHVFKDVNQVKELLQ